MKNKYYSLYIIAICVIFFILQKIFPIITQLFKLTSSLVLQQPYTIITSMFLHGSLVHLLFNMVSLAIFGLILENEIGSKRFLYLYFSAGIFASISSIPFYPAVLGASGAIFGIIGSLALLKPKMTIWVYGLPMPMFVAAILYAIIDLLGVFAPSNVANIAHLAGILVGVLFGLILRTKIKKEQKTKEKDLNEKNIQEWEKRYMK
ncbi:rhomboid family intramembrane serine protease [Candidatus Woesearchaeota archaeon]|nr:rhomboid family intramembrane serine protease [Candidatus Woesearchaeota archaeon]